MTINKIISIFSPLVYLKISLNNKINKLHKQQIILSFDCDTAEDAIASIKITEFLESKKIPAVFAIPGCELEKNAEIYRTIKQKGFEFINHGYLPHAIFDAEKGYYVSQTWYKEMRNSDVENDIIKGHATIHNILGVEASGFRAPHFGTYQKSSQLKLIYKQAEQLKYTHCSTTTPINSILKGNVYKASSNIFEFPVCGRFNIPFWILDSWSFYNSVEKIMSQEYEIEAKNLLNFLFDKKTPCLLSLYVDPAHVLNSDYFFNVIKHALKLGFEFTSYQSFLKSNKCAELQG